MLRVFDGSARTLQKVARVRSVPRPYEPPRTRRPQAVKPAGSASARFRSVRLPLAVAFLAVLGGTLVLSQARTPAPEQVASPRAATTPAGATTPASATSASNGTAARVAQPTARPTPQPPGESASPSATQPALVEAAGARATAVPARDTVQEAAGQPYYAYTVQPGDTIRSIADRYAVSAANVSQASGLRDPDHLRVGQLLTIPREPGWLYRVQPGESLETLAARFGVSTEAIQAASLLSDAAVHPGDVVLIPEQRAARSK